MKSEKTKMVIASILLLIRSAIFIVIGTIVIIENIGYYYSFWEILYSILILLYGIAALLIGIFSIVISRNEDRMIRRKAWVLTFAILSIFQSWIAALLLFLSYDAISKAARNNNALPNAPNNAKNENKKEKVKKYISPEKRKIDILAKLGVLLVVLSGLILATSYNNIFSSDLSKPIIMAILFIIFRVLYRLFETKVKIESSSKLYYILSYVFFVLIFVSIGYFSIISYDLSFEGYFSNLMYSIVFLSLSYSLISIRNKYNYKVLGEISFALVIISLVLVLNQYNFENMQIVGILLVLSLFMNLNKEKLQKCIININDLMFALLGLYYLLDFGFYYELDLFRVLIGIFIIALLRQRIVNNERFACACRYILPAFVNLLIVITLLQASNSCSMNNTSSIFITPQIFNYRLITIVILLFSNYFFLRSDTKEMIHSGLISSIVLALIETISMLNLEYSMVSVLASIIIFSYITIILKIAQKPFIRIICFITQLISLLLLAISGVMFYKNNGIVVTYDTIITVYLLFVMALNKLEKNVFEEYKMIRPVYFTTVITLLITCSVFITNHNVVYNLIMLTFLFIYRRYSNIYEKRKQVFNYLLLVVVFLNMSAVIITFTSVLITNLILLLGLLITAYYVSRQKYTSYFILCLSYVPYVLALSELTMEHDLFVILSRLPLMLLVFVITRKILSMKRKANCIVEIVLLSIVFLSYIFEVELTLGLFTFILALIMIYIGFRNEKFNSLFIVGIGATLLNIIVQLGDFWSSVPLPVYLLISGLIIIGYVTYKEISKSKKQEEKKEDKKEIEEKIDTHNNLANIILLIITCSCVLINYFNTKTEIELKSIREAEIILKEKGINLNKIHFDKKTQNLYILEGTHYDVDVIIEQYDPGYKAKKYNSYYVTYVDSKDLTRIKNNEEYYDDSYRYYYGEGQTKSFYYSGPINRETTVSGVTFTVKNDIINYLGGSYSYGYYNTGRNNVDFVYNIHDADKLELYISNVQFKKITVTTSRGTKEIYQDGYYTFIDRAGEVNIKIEYYNSNYDNNETYYDQN